MDINSNGTKNGHRLLPESDADNTDRAKWVNRIELTEHNVPGYWEQAGYHNVGDPWKEQRYRDDPEWLSEGTVADGI